MSYVAVVYLILNKCLG